MMAFFKAKRKFSQHFLKNRQEAKRILSHLGCHGNYEAVLEIGPGLGILTRELLGSAYHVHAVEIDPRAVEYLREHFPKGLQLWEGDILKMNCSEKLPKPCAWVGNLPYAISAPIMFKLLEARDEVPEALFLLQKEVVDRIVSAPGSKSYGLLSVLLQAYYRVESLYSLAPEAFEPSPKVHSSLLRLRRLPFRSLSCRHEDLVSLTKMAFSKRRKMLRNTLADSGIDLPARYASLRAEQLSVADFVYLAERLPDQSHRLQ